MKSEIKPWQWATMAERSDPVEVVSYPIPPAGGTGFATVMVRTVVGDPTTITEVPTHQLVAVYAPSAHVWANRPRRYYDPNNPSAFAFAETLNVSQRWQGELEAELLGIPNESVVGKAVVQYLAVADGLLAITEEPSERSAIIAACVKQCNVWYFG